MMRIGHITDLHLNGTRDRFQKTVGAARRAWQMGARWLLVTGDLTKDGGREQFAELGGALATGWTTPEGAPSDRVTIVPGNHDGPTSRFMEALTGPLSRYTRTSTPGSVVDLGDARIVAINTQYRPMRSLIFRAIGRVGDEQLKLLAGLASEANEQRALVVAMHHPPVEGPLGIFHGLVDRDRVLGVLGDHPHVFMCAGHDHRVLTAGNVFVAGSVAVHDGDPLRLYDLKRGKLVPAYESMERGSYFAFARRAK